MEPPTWHREVILADGTTVHIRPISPGDGPAMVAFHSALSSESVYLRFFGPHPRLSEQEVERFTHVDGDSRMALVAIFEDRVIAVARYDRSPAERAEAEVAFVVADAYQRHGLGTLMLQHLADQARLHGITVFVAQSLAHNRAMQDVFAHAGFETRSRFSQGIVDVRMALGDRTRRSEADPTAAEADLQAAGHATNAARRRGP